MRLDGEEVEVVGAGHRAEGADRLGDIALLKHGRHGMPPSHRPAGKPDVAPSEEGQRRAPVRWGQLLSTFRAGAMRSTFCTVSGANDRPWVKAPRPVSTAAKNARSASSRVATNAAVP